MAKARESTFSLLFRHWIRANPDYTCALELKQTTSDYLNFNEVSPEQINYGLAISGSKGVLIRTTGVKGLPDYIWLSNEPTFVVIKYPFCFVLILIEIFVKEKQTSKVKSLTSARARQIASKVVEL